MPIHPDDRADLITCWCGDVGTYEDLFDDDGLRETCCGLGELDCHCGGDLCVCHHHGSTSCPGCEDCDHDEDYDDDLD